MTCNHRTLGRRPGCDHDLQAAVEAVHGDLGFPGTVYFVDRNHARASNANAGTNPVSDANDWFKAVLQDETGIEIVYVRTHTSGSTTFSNIQRAQEGTSAKAFAIGSVFGIRFTATDAENSLGVVASSPASAIFAYQTFNGF